jgi:hypothetical protein
MFGGTVVVLDDGAEQDMDDGEGHGGEEMSKF